MEVRGPAHVRQKAKLEDSNTMVTGRILTLGVEEIEMIWYHPRCLIRVSAGI